MCRGIFFRRSFHEKKIQTVELFAGVGGFRIGLEKASSAFNFIWSNQWEPGQKSQWAYHCYVKHFGDEQKCSNQDIATTILEVPEHDLLCAGFPCQDYSVARTDAPGLTGTKGNLWWSINEIIKFRHPMYIFLENVDRLIKSPTKQRGRDFGIILHCLMTEGYAVEWRIINASDYGCAQKRKRTFILAYRRGTGFYQTLDSISSEDQLENWILADGIFGEAFPVKKTIIRK